MTQVNDLKDREIFVDIAYKKGENLFRASTKVLLSDMGIDIDEGISLEVDDTKLRLISMMHEEKQEDEFGGDNNPYDTGPWK